MHRDAVSTALLTEVGCLSGGHLVLSLLLDVQLDSLGLSALRNMVILDLSESALFRKGTHFNQGCQLVWPLASLSGLMA